MGSIMSQVKSIELLNLIWTHSPRQLAAHVLGVRLVLRLQALAESAATYKTPIPKIIKTRIFPFKRIVSFRINGIGIARR